MKIFLIKPLGFHTFGKLIYKKESIKTVKTPENVSHAA